MDIKSLFANKHKNKAILSIITILIILIAFSTASFAWLSGVVINKGNTITAATSQLKLLTVDKAVDVTQKGFLDNQSLPLPTSISEVFFEQNGLVSLDDKNSDRKFFEYQNKAGISDVQPGFRQYRPLIIQNTTENELKYTVDFLTKEIQNEGLSTAFFFNYTKIGGDILNQNLNKNNNTTLNAGNTTKSLGINIEKIGQAAAVTIKPNCSHIYMVDMGILSTAGNSIQGAGLTLDIVLSIVNNGDKTKLITDQNSFENALMLNAGGETFILANDVEISKALVSSKVFNLDLNGNKLIFKTNGTLKINFPDYFATVDFGSDLGGLIINAKNISFVGVKNKSVLTWYTDISGLNSPDNSSNLILNLKTTPINNQSQTGSNANINSSQNGSSSSNASQSSSSSSSSSATSSQPSNAYIDYQDIAIASSIATGNGTEKNPYLITNLGEFKYFVEDSNDTNWYRLNINIERLNLPAKVTKVKKYLYINDNMVFNDINIIGETQTKSINFLYSVGLGNQAGFALNDSDYKNYFKNIYYNGVQAE